jgi:hypothetical protein
MLVRFLPPSPKANQQLRPDLPIGWDDIGYVSARALSDAGLAEEVKYNSYQQRLRLISNGQPVLAPAVVSWGTSTGVFNSRVYISAKCSRPNCSTLIYDARPDSSLEKLEFIHSAGCGSPEKIPQSVCEQYRKVWRAANTLTRDELSFASECYGGPTRADIDAESAVAKMKERYEDVASRDPFAKSYGIENYGKTIDRPYDLPNKKK